MTIISKIDIEKPIEEVFSFVANPLNDHLWKKKVFRTTYINQNKVGEGLIFEQEMKFLFKKINFVYIITSYKKNDHFTITSLDTPYKITQTIHLKFLEVGKTNIHIYTSELVDDNFMKLFSFIIEPIFLKSIKQDYIRLKEVLSNQL